MNALSKMAKVSVDAAKLASFSLIIGLAYGEASYATTFKASATTTGFDSGFNRISENLDGFFGTSLFTAIAGQNDFFRVSFDEGPTDVFIKSVTFDLTETLEAISDAYFDPIELGFDATPKVGLASGINIGDISFSPVERGTGPLGFGPSSLTISFALGSFGLGDFFTFGADSNAVGSDSLDFLAFLNPFFMDDVTLFNDTGADFANAGVRFLVELESGETSSSIFQQAGLFSSLAELGIAQFPNGTETAMLAQTNLGGTSAATMQTSLVSANTFAGPSDATAACQTIGASDFGSAIGLDGEALESCSIILTVLQQENLFSSAARVEVNLAGGGGTSVPEPGSVLGLLAALTAGFKLLKQKL